ncbi:hypothetical protein AMATHDRAFT_134903 [Amanita thiersii Skay4041]|uniref:Amino acid transporter transmembrane domain-containing protein n=1 Tax=Amanita thiersii Skay4041 TaxID=703135 RepID=A0A2A9P1I4_9AGAR|nr:hypothetical protein AMATHDRAFT_134903 [Amanita thiersii Skay4041]
MVAESPAIRTIRCPDFEVDSSSEEEEDATEIAEELPGPSSPPNDFSFVSELPWDEDSEQGGRTPKIQPHVPRPNRVRIPRRSRRLQRPRTISDVTPLLQAPPPVALDIPVAVHEQQNINSQGYLAISDSFSRRLSVSSKSIRQTHTGQSTFGQTLFNATAILLGIGLLSEPLAFSYAGWTAGTILIIFYAFIASYTAKILARVIVADPRMKTYSDIGRKAFGPRSYVIISFLFCLELFGVSVVLVTLYADSLHAIFPQYPSTTYKIMGCILLIPMVFLPLSLLSYASILGVVSTILLVIVVFIDGFSKQEAPGSLLNPDATNIGVQSFQKLGIAFGLFMAGFAGHAVIPSLARDMIDPSQSDRMINWAFTIATVVYTAIGYAGYLMFGDNVSDEISRDLLQTKGYNPVLNQLVLWMLVVSPITKFALNNQPVRFLSSIYHTIHTCVRQLNATVEAVLGISMVKDNITKSNDGTFDNDKLFLKRCLTAFQRILLTIMTVIVSIAVPQFSAVMAFLGSVSAFMINIVGPVAVKVAMQRYCGVFDGAILVIGVAMAIWGTTSVVLAA